MNRDEICDKFLDVLQFDLYPFQEEALLAWFEIDGGLLVTAPTGMGKTLVAEAAIFEALHTRRRIYYTTPLIALTDQKFREFQDRAEAWGFDRDDVGLITGNRRVNPDAIVRVVVAEILLNHILSPDNLLGDTAAVVMDEFHNFNDFERGVVWELSLVLLPKNIRLMLLSATVGNAIEFTRWLREEHDRPLRIVQTDERRVPLEFSWIDDKLITDHLLDMLDEDDAAHRAPALVFCFNRDECWEVAERLKGLSLIPAETRKRIDEELDPAVFRDGIGPKLRQMLIRGVGVHHAGVLPKYKETVERLFLAKLIPFVVCTETLAAGINLPARSVVLRTLLKGKPRERKLLPPSTAHQIFGRAGRPQFDTKGYVFVLAHEDDAKIRKWQAKYEKLDSGSKDPGIMRARKALERKRPSRRKTEQYWSEGQLKTLIKASPANLASRAMIPYQVLIYLLNTYGALHYVREFLAKRFNTPDRLEGFQKQLDHMIANLAAFGFLVQAEDGDHVTLDDSITTLLDFRSVDPLYGSFLAQTLAPASLEEKLDVLESVLPLPPAIQRPLFPPEDAVPGPLQTSVIEPALIKAGILSATGSAPEPDGPESLADRWDDDFEENHDPRNLPEMLAALYETRLASPEIIPVQPKRVLGGLLDFNKDFFKFTAARNLQKNEGLMLRHLLRLVILAGEFHTRTDDPDYQRIAEDATDIGISIDPRYTDNFLSNVARETKGTAL
ncbi:MAG: DEAD/DEAH box helicase [Planctomycetes bacterium]|nr:DEAD/DEAH box helicase [Planctomycetota bacterium]